MTTLFGRRVIPTTLDPVPRAFRAVPGMLAVSHLELAALEAGDGDTFKLLAEIARAEDASDTMRTWVFKKRKVTKSTPKIAPSSRMVMLNAIYKGRT